MDITSFHKKEKRVTIEPYHYERCEHLLSILTIFYMLLLSSMALYSSSLSVNPQPGLTEKEGVGGLRFIAGYYIRIGRKIVAHAERRMGMCL